ncbi:MAG TPA: sugar transferase [Ktedonobacteraceae bacterium]|nr:sugar transferase [Ktedonobacteraceae bacterium]
MTRLLDLLAGSLVLIIAAPIMLVVALLIKCDSRGPIIYGSPRVGKNGRTFLLLRFRTVDINKPAHLDMKQRLTRAGRFIRNYSLDDLPNIINVLKGDLSLVGPRPTEPESVDLDDPAWQKVLTVRPGYISWAILELASAYNTSPWPLKLRLEEEYIQKKSLLFDVFALQKAARRLIASKGNVKARGVPAVRKRER